MRPSSADFIARLDSASRLGYNEENDGGGIAMEPLVTAMIAYERGVPQRVQHFLKVYAFAQAIAQGEGADEATCRVLEAAALVHDIGIKPALEIYGSSAGPHQEELGPGPAREMLTGLGYDPALVERVAYLVGHHHSYGQIDGLDYQILVEADFLVNLFEESEKKEAILSAYRRIFKTDAGKTLCRQMFGLSEEE